MDLVVVEAPLCRDAAVQLGEPYKNVVNTVYVDHERYPAGCFTHLNYVYVNHNIDPSSTSPYLSSAGICRSGMVVKDDRV